MSARYKKILASMGEGGQNPQDTEILGWYPEEVASLSLVGYPSIDGQIYCPKELESIFIETTLPNKPSYILGTI